MTDDKDYLEGIYEATVDAIAKAEGEVRKLQGISKPPFPELAASMNEWLENLREDADKLLDALSA